MVTQISKQLKYKLALLNPDFITHVFLLCFLDSKEKKKPKDFFPPEKLYFYLLKERFRFLCLLLFVYNLIRNELRVKFSFDLGKCGLWLCSKLTGQPSSIRLPDLEKHFCPSSMLKVISWQVALLDLIQNLTPQWKKKKKVQFLCKVRFKAYWFKWTFIQPKCVF